jgi:hypothetical protein
MMERKAERTPMIPDIFITLFEFCVCVCVCVCVYVYVCMYVRCYSYVSFIYISVCVYVCVFMCVCVCVCVYRLLEDVVLVNTVGFFSYVNEFDTCVLTDTS